MRKRSIHCQPAPGTGNEHARQACDLSGSNFGAGAPGGVQRRETMTTTKIARAAYAAYATMRAAEADARAAEATCAAARAAVAYAQMRATAARAAYAHLAERRRWGAEERHDDDQDPVLRAALAAAGGG